MPKKLLCEIDKHFHKRVCFDPSNPSMVKNGLEDYHLPFPAMLVHIGEQYHKVGSSYPWCVPKLCSFVIVYVHGHECRHKKALVAWSVWSCMPFHGLSDLVHCCHNQRRFRARCWSWKLTIPRPPNSFGEQTVCNRTRHFALEVLSEPDHRNARLSLSSIFSSH